MQSISAGDESIATRSPWPGALFTPIVLSPFLCAADVCFGRKEWITTPPIVLALIVTGACALIACALHPRHVLATVGAGKSILFGLLVLAVMGLYGQMRAFGEVFGTDAREAFLPIGTVIIVYLGLNVAVLCRNDASWRIGSLLTMMMLFVTIAWDSRYPGTFSSVDTRAAGFGVNPNGAAAFTILALIGALNWKDERVTLASLLTIALAGSAVFLTLSRSGLLTLVMVCGYYFLRTMKRSGARTAIILLGLGCPAILFAASASDWLQRSIPMLEYTTSRLEAFTGNVGAMDHGEDSRLELMQGYFELAIERPWLGWGNGVMLPGVDVFAHNIYLWRWVQQGCISLFAVLFLMRATYSLGKSLHSPECTIFAAFLFLQGWFSHNLFEDRPIILTWAILVGRAACAAYDAKQRSLEADSSALAGTPIRARVPMMPTTALASGSSMGRQKSRSEIACEVWSRASSATSSATDKRSTNNSVCVSMPSNSSPRVSPVREVEL